MTTKPATPLRLHKTMNGCYEIRRGDNVVGKLFAAVGAGGYFTGSWFFYFGNGKWSRSYSSGRAAWDAAKRSKQSN